MVHRLGLLISVVPLALLLVYGPVPLAAASATPSYAVTNLGLPPDADPTDSSMAYGMNNRGQVVGLVRSVQLVAGQPGPRRITHGFLWNQATGSMVDLQVLIGGDNSEAHAINAIGQIVGDADGQAFVWDARSGVRQLGSLPGGFGASATAINNSVQIVGDSNGHAFLWDEHIGMRDLGTVPGCSTSAATAINDPGLVSGIDYESGVPHAFLWDQTKGMRDLGVLPGTDESSAMGMNNRGEVVGFASTGFGARPFLWTPAGGIQALAGTLPVNSFAYAVAINDSAQVVGWSIPAGAPQYAALYDSAGNLKNLNTLIGPGSPWFVSEARAINQQGSIGGTGYTSEPGAGLRALLLTPT